jgi:NAD+ diphosphatase
VIDHLARSQRNAFVTPLRRLQDRRLDPDWVEAALHAATTRFVPVWQARVPFQGEAPPRAVLLTPEEAAPLLPQAEALALLAEAAQGPIFALALRDEAALPERVMAHARLDDLRGVAALLDGETLTLLAYARALADWHHHHRFCGACGSATESRWAGHVRVCTNPACGELHFPRTDPAIIVRVNRGERCLLGRKAAWGPGRYSNIAGFVEPVESLENAVVREVQEETDVRLRRVTYFSSQPWPFPRSLMLAFTAEAATETIHRNDRELEDARWFTRAEVRRGLEDGSLGLPSPVSISFRLLADWFDRGDQGPLAELVAVP